MSKVNELLYGNLEVIGEYLDKRRIPGIIRENCAYNEKMISDFVAYARDYQFLTVNAVIESFESHVALRF